MPSFSLEQAESLAHFHLVITGFETAINSPKSLAQIKKRSSTKILGYLAMNEFPLGMKNQEPWKSFFESLEDDDFLKDTLGNFIGFWPGARMYNLTRPTVREKLARLAEDLMKLNSAFDGIFLDNLWSDISWLNQGNIDADLNGKKDNPSYLDSLWKVSEQKTLELIRNRLGNKRIIVANEQKISFGQNRLNGRMWEGVRPDNNFWPQLISSYLAADSEFLAPRFNVVHAKAQRKDTSTIEFGLAVTLLGNGYFAASPGPPEFHDKIYWYPSLYQKLGKPKEKAWQDTANNIWVRTFEKGTVLLNPSYSPKNVLWEEKSILLHPRSGKILR
jgi:hypothetical protein